MLCKKGKPRGFLPLLIGDDNLLPGQWLLPFPFMRWKITKHVRRSTSDMEALNITVPRSSS